MTDYKAYLPHHRDELIQKTERDINIFAGLSSLVALAIIAAIIMHSCVEGVVSEVERQKEYEPRPRWASETYRKPGDNPEPITHTNESFPVAIWQRFADPVWVTAGAIEDDGFCKLSMDINPSDTLQKNSAREEKDERHICPLQLEVIRRGIELWSNPGDVVYDPFTGIGSTQYVAIKNGRRGLGSELKESYFKQAVLNCKSAFNDTMPLFREAA